MASTIGSMESVVVRRPRFFRWSLIWKAGTGMFCLAGLAVLAATAYVSQDPSRCASCHRMEAKVDSWKHSPHKSISCTNCHEGHGAFQVIGSSIGLKGKKDKESSKDKSCKKCHSKDSETKLDDGRIAPKRHSDKDRQKGCTKCHTSVGHGWYVEPYLT